MPENRVCLSARPFAFIVSPQSDGLQICVHTNSFSYFKIMFLGEEGKGKGGGERRGREGRGGNGKRGGEEKRELSEEKEGRREGMELK